MTRALLAASAAAVLLVLAGPAAAGGGGLGDGAPRLEDDEKHICVVTDSHKREGYCVYTYGVELPDRP